MFFLHGETINITDKFFNYTLRKRSASALYFKAINVISRYVNASVYILNSLVLGRLDSKPVVMFYLYCTWPQIIISVTDKP